MHRSFLPQLFATAMIISPLLLLPANAQNESKECETSTCKIADFIYDYVLIDTPVTNTTREEFRQMFKDVFD